MLSALAVFVGCAALVGYAYVGYPLYCLVRAAIWRRPMAAAKIRPSVSVIVAAYRERDALAAKLETLAAQRYPAELLEVIVACDGSDDGTPERAREVGAPLFGDRLTVLALPRAGKPAALNAAVARARGELLVFTDARQRLAPDAVVRLVEDLADSTVGAVGGRLVLEGDEPVSAYWRYESLLRELEGRSGSTVGVSGALYAMRRALYQPLPDETILDDLLVPSRVRLAGLRVGYDRFACAYDRAAPADREFRRKVRTLAGNFQLLLLEPALLLPWRNPAWFDLFSHKLVRLFVPYLLVTLVGAAAMLPPPLGAPLVAAQLLFYALAALRMMGLGRRSRLLGLCETFVVLNAAAVAGLARFLRYRRRLPW